MAVNPNLIHVGPGVLVIDSGLATAVTVEVSEEGGTLAYSQALEFIEIDEAIGAVEAFVTGEECAFSLICQESEATKLKLAMGYGTITTTAASAGVKGKDVMDFGGNAVVTKKTLKYTVPRRHNPSLSIIIDLYSVVAVPSLEKKFTKKGKALIAITFRALQDLTKVAGKRLGTITYETAEATS